MKFGSYLLSVLLHASLLVLVLLWPETKPIQLDQVMYQVSLVEGAPGGESLPSPVLGPKDAAPPSKMENKPLPSMAAQEATTVNEPSPTEIPADSKPEPKPLVENKPLPVEAPKETPKEKPKETPETTPEPIKGKEEPKKPEPKKEEPKPEPKTEAPKETKKDDKAAGQSPEDALKELAKAKGATNQRAQSSVAGALAEMKKQVKRQKGGGGGEGDGPGGGGLDDVYRGMVYMAIYPNWVGTSDDRTPLTAVVNVKLDKQGKILTFTLKESSGNARFDNSVLTAVNRTKVLPPPPTPAQQDLDLGFDSRQFGGQ